MHSANLITQAPPNLRNGAARDVTPLVLGDSIQSKFYHAPIQVRAAIPQAPTPAEIDAHWSAIMASGPYIAEYIYHMLDDGPDAERGHEMRRRHAIVLGVARAVIIAAYQLTPNDFNPNECKAPEAWVYVARAGDVPAHYEPPTRVTSITRAVRIAEYSNVLVNSAHVGLAAALAAHPPPAGVTAPAAMPDEAVDVPDSKDFGPFSVAETALANAVAKFAQVIPPLAGAAFQESSHILTKQTYKVYKGAMSQAGLLGVKRSQDVKDAVEGFTEEGNDSLMGILIHKSVHPVRRNLLVAFANDEKMGERMRSLGLASAALRVPYRNGVYKRAETFIKVVESSQPGSGAGAPEMKGVRGAMAAVVSAGAYDELKNMSSASDQVRTELDNARDDANGELPNAVKRRFADRCLELELDRVSRDVAYCKGYVEAQLRDVGLRGKLLNAFCLKTLTSAWPARVAAGSKLFEDQARWDRANPDGRRPVAPRATGFQAPQVD